MARTTGASMTTKERSKVYKRINHIAPENPDYERIVKQWMMQQGSVLIVHDGPKRPRLVIAMNICPMLQFWFDAYGNES